MRRPPTQVRRARVSRMTPRLPARTRAIRLLMPEPKRAERTARPKMARTRRHDPAARHPQAAQHRRRRRRPHGLLPGPAVARTPPEARRAAEGATPSEGARPPANPAARHRPPNAASARRADDGGMRRFRPRRPAMGSSRRAGEAAAAAGDQPPRSRNRRRRRPTGDAGEQRPREGAAPIAAPVPAGSAAERTWRGPTR